MEPVDYILQTRLLIDLYSVRLENILKRIKYKLTLGLNDDKLFDDLLGLIEEYGQTYREIGWLETLAAFLRKVSIVFSDSENS